MKYITFIIIILFTWSALAVEHVNQGDVVSKEGYIFTVKEEQKLRADNEKRKLLERLVIKFEDKIVLQEYQIDLYKEHVESTRPLTGWQKVGYFALGFITTSASLYLSSKVLKNID